jgi:hypothetical protein
MKKTITTILLTMLSCILFAQDLIITSKGDSINGKITKVKRDNIYFTFKHNDEVRSTLLPTHEVKNHQFNFFSQSEVLEKDIVGFKDYQQFRIAFNAGYSYRTARIADNIPTEFKEYTQGLKSGYNLGGNITYFNTEIFGLGATCNVFKSSNSIANASMDVGDGMGTVVTGTLQENISILFAGPTFTTRLFSHSKENSFFASYSLGLLRYTDKIIMVDDYKMYGNTIGYALDLGYDWKVSEDLALGIQLSFFSGYLTSYKFTNGFSTQTVKLDRGEYEGLGRIDLSVGLRFGK